MSQVGSELKQAMPLDPLYYGANDGKVHEKSTDYYKITRYNNIVRKMTDICWRCPKAPIKYHPRCSECVKKYLGVELPDVRIIIKNKETL